jgi:cell wall assembly regulator SMI1
MTITIWDRFEAMLIAHAPNLLGTLRPPATEAQIALAESELGVQLPEDIRRASLCLPTGGLVWLTW